MMTMRMLGVVGCAVVGSASSGCNRSSNVDLEAALQNTRRGEYRLVVVADPLVSFQGSFRKDQWRYTGALPVNTLDRIKAAVVAGSRPDRVVRFADVRAGSEISEGE